MWVIPAPPHTTARAAHGSWPHRKGGLAGVPAHLSFAHQGHKVLADCSESSLSTSRDRRGLQRAGLHATSSTLATI